MTALVMKQIVGWADLSSKCSCRSLLAAMPGELGSLWPCSPVAMKRFVVSATRCGLLDDETARECFGSIFAEKQGNC